MSRYTGPTTKLSRREGQELFLKGDRSFTDKAARRLSVKPGQAQSNFRKSLYTLLLVIYLGILDTSTIGDFVALSDRLSALKDMEIPEDTILEIKSIIDEISDRITADKVL